MRLLDPLASRTLEKSRLGSRKSQDDSLAARSFRSRVMALLVSIPLLALMAAPAAVLARYLLFFTNGTTSSAAAFRFASSPRRS